MGLELSCHERLSHPDVRNHRSWSRCPRRSAVRHPRAAPCPAAPVVARLRFGKLLSRVDGFLVAAARLGPRITGRRACSPPQRLRAFPARHQSAGLRASTGANVSTSRVRGGHAVVAGCPQSGNRRSRVIDGVSRVKPVSFFACSSGPSRRRFSPEAAVSATRRILSRIRLPGRADRQGSRRAAGNSWPARPPAGRVRPLRARSSPPSSQCVRPQRVALMRRHC